METNDHDLCRVCGDGAFKQACEKSGHRYVECASCGVVRQYPYPRAEEIREFYRNYQSYKTANSPYLSDSYREAYCREKCQTFADLGFDPANFQGKRLLDVGCATGQFLEFLADKKLQSAEGIDVSPEVIATAVAHGLNCREADFLSIDGSFDFTSMWHVIEHVPDPVAYLRHAHQLLGPGGCCFVETPVVGPVSRAFAADWRFFMPVEHIHLFTQAALFQLARDCGFAIRSWITFGSGNGSGLLPPANKRAMDTLVKRLGLGDTLSVWLLKEPHSLE